jgi:hypothetical protein
MRAPDAVEPAVAPLAPTPALRLPFGDTNRQDIYLACRMGFRRLRATFCCARTTAEAFRIRWADI